MSPLFSRWEIVKSDCCLQLTCGEMVVAEIPFALSEEVAWKLANQIVVRHNIRVDDE